MGTFLNVFGVVIAAWQSSAEDQDPPADGTPFFILLGCCGAMFIIAIGVVIVFRVVVQMRPDRKST